MSKTIDQILSPLQRSFKDVIRHHASRDYIGNTFLVPDSESPLSHKAILQTLKQRPQQANEGHFGIGNVLMNFKMIAASRCAFAILADANPLQIELFDTNIDLVRKHPTAQDFYAELLSQYSSKYFRGLISSYRKQDEQIHLQHEFEDGLGEPENYAHLRHLAQSGNVVSFHLDLFDEQRTKQLASNLSASGRTLGTIYLTNLPWFLQKDGDFYNRPIDDDTINRFWQNISTLSNGDRTLICDAQHESNEIVYAHYDRGPSTKDYRHQVLCGTQPQRRDSHIAKRHALKADRGSLAFYRP